MRLRIYRTFRWEPGPGERVIGAPAQLTLASRDELQYETEDGAWRPVDIVEAEKPEHPDERQRRELCERLAPRMGWQTPEFLGLAGSKLPKH